MSEQLQRRIRDTTLPAIPFTGGHGHLLQRKCACGGSPGVDGECAECREKRLSMQRSATGSVGPSLAVPPVVYEVLRSPGQPLDAGTRAFMEPRFGHDFSNVCVHSDARAAESAQAVNALAYTVGRDVVFGVGQYAPQTGEGRRLMAHELTHVAQQGNSIQRKMDKLEIGHPQDAFEREAELSANAILQAGELVSIQSNKPVQISRQQATQSPTAPTTTAQGRYWSAVRRDLQSALNARGINGSEPFWNNFHNTLGFLSLITKIERYGILSFISKITNTWFGATVFGMGFHPTNGANLLGHLQKSQNVVNDIFPSTMHPGATWSFRDKIFINSLHITGNSNYQAHIDNFNPMSMPPIGAVLHGLVDLIPSALGL